MGVTGIEKIRLLILTPTLECGGSEKYVSLLCNHINTDKFSVTLAVLNNASPFYTIRDKEILVTDLKVKHVRKSLNKIREIIKQQRPDIVFSTANHLNIYLAVFRKLLPEKMVFIARESSLVSMNKTRVKFPFFYDRLVKKYYKRFDHIICQSQYMQQDLISNYNIPEHKTVVIHNPVETFLQEEAVISENIAFGKVYKFITVARLSEEKGVKRLIQAVGLLSIPFQFYIIGEGDKKKYLQSLVHELHLEGEIFFKGESAKPFKGMEDADLFLFGSYYEGFPNVLLEAGVLGIPVIAFNVAGGISEIISAENGILVDDNDIIGFAVALQKGLQAGFNRNQIIEITKKRFSVNTIMPAIEKLFVQLTQPNK